MMEVRVYDHSKPPSRVGASSEWYFGLLRSGVGQFVGRRPACRFSFAKLEVCFASHEQCKKGRGQGERGGVLMRGSYDGCRVPRTVRTAPTLVHRGQSTRLALVVTISYEVHSA